MERRVEALDYETVDGERATCFALQGYPSEPTTLV